MKISNNFTYDLYKLACDFEKIARKKDALEILKNNIGNYIHFSNSDRFGISFHKNIHPGNPRGIYGFKLTPQKYQSLITKKDLSYNFEYFEHSKYIYIFDVKGNILNLDELNIEDMFNKIKEFINIRNPTEINNYNFTFGKPKQETRFIQNDSIIFLRWLNQVSKSLFKNEHSGLNILLRGIGYDAIETNDFGFGDSLKSEIAVLNPSTINLIDKIENPLLSREDIKEIDYLNSDEYKWIKEQEKLKKERQIEEKLKYFKEREDFRNKIKDMNKQIRMMPFGDERVKKLEELIKLEKEFNERQN